jgi:hypothetical protein
MCKKVEMCGQNLVNMFNFITEMDSQKEKRMRGANFSADEKALLLVTVQKYKIKSAQVVFTYLPSFLTSGALFTRIPNCRGPFENSYLPNSYTQIKIIDAV